MQIILWDRASWIWDEHDGELKFFLGIQITQRKYEFYVHQSKYTKELLKKFKLEDYKVTNTHMHPTCNLIKEEESSKVCRNLYRGVIGSLLYLTSSMPDILFSVSMCARFQSDPRKTHLTIVKRIFRYLKGITNLGLLYKNPRLQASWIMWCWLCWW